MIGALLLSLAVLPASAQQVTVTNNGDGLSFTNVSIESWTGYQYQGNTGDSTALLGASIDIGTFNAGNLGQLDYGLGTELTIANASSFVQGMSIRAELAKNLSSAQIKGFVGGGRDYKNLNYYGEFGVELNFNLYRAQSWFSFAGTGINFRFTNGQAMEYLPCVRTGIAF